MEERMDEFNVRDSKDGFSMKLWRGERMCLIGFDVAEPEPDLVGFAIEVKSPTSDRFWALRNRLAFSYDAQVATAVTGDKQYLSTEAPFQKYRWMHFPQLPGPGLYTYRGTKIHMPQDGKLVAGTSISLQISLDPVTYANFLDIGFTRNVASSQAYAEQFGNRTDVIPSDPDHGLTFQKLKLQKDIYAWMGFEAYELIFNFLNECVNDPAVDLDLLAFDLNECDIVDLLEKMGPRLRAIIDDSRGSGETSGHKPPTSAESMAAARLAASAGADHIKRMHFQRLQHNKVLVARRNGTPYKVLTGSTNFSFRGIYIQANNVLVFTSPDVAGFYSQMFNMAFDNPRKFRRGELASKWFPFTSEGNPPVQFCFSPHLKSELSLGPLAQAIDGATSSVLYSVAFLSQGSKNKETAFDRLIGRPLFSYGIVDKRGNLAVQKPDGSVGLVDFGYLQANAPEPFQSEWSGGKGINVHHKFVVTDFSLPTAKVFTGSSNLASGGEQQNGDNLVLIEDCRVATSYAIEALRLFDHLHFRSRMKDALHGTKAQQKAEALTLKKPTAISGEPAWFEQYYVAGSERERDRMLFSC
jgi:phosphatidylserine/phosphatidylglycerophosphate/cardiolipin synthase-like enzyme